jgi:hypothetical protein
MIVTRSVSLDGMQDVVTGDALRAPGVLVRHPIELIVNRLELFAVSASLVKLLANEPVAPSMHWMRVSRTTPD